jgi:hypothetical protein
LAETLTPNFGWTKPDPGASANTWGTTLNATTDKIDAQVFVNQTAISNITAQYGANTIILNAPNVAAGVSIRSQVAGVSRWQITPCDGEAETGGNAGSNFLIQAFNDSGAYLNTPLEIVRATGLVQMSANLGVSGTTTTGNLNVTGTTTTGNLSVSGSSGLSVSSPGITYGGTSGNSIAFGWDGAYLDGYVNTGLIGAVTYGIAASGYIQFSNWGFHNATLQVQANYPGSPGGAVVWPVTLSDRRLKSNIRDATLDALGLLARLKVHSADFKNPFHDGPSEHWDCALIADEVQRWIPHAYIPPLENGYAGIRELPLIATLIKAVQQLTERLAALERAP